LGIRVIDKSLPIRSIEFNACAQEYKAFDFIADWYIGLFFGVGSPDIRSPAVVLLTDQYFADTAAKISP
jgi:hypothetical protein